MTVQQTPIRRRRSGNLWTLPFLLPAGIFVAAIVLIPSAMGVVYAFTDWTGGPGWSWVGLANFERMLNDQLARDALWHTLALTAMTTIAMNVLGILFALGLNSRIRAKTLLRVIFFAPVVVTPVIVANLWKYIYLPDGPLNELLRALGLDELATSWLGNSDTALGAIAVIVIWQFTGIAMVIYLAGLQNVPTELLEAAQLDGAGAFKRFWYIVLPQLRPALVIVSMLTIIAGLKIFDQVWVTTQGGPGSATATLSTAQYQVTFLIGNFAYGAAFAVALSVLAVVAALLQQVVARRGADNA
ncbi:carbohydrate ABC transporter permease [Microbacterium sp. F51-2R]|uniref:carbohydrate ABC transporter permease n=1 Tax=Microbacterium sp. F51-2R TaxID=3445777 RepID=UPI003FA1500E